MKKIVMLIMAVVIATALAACSNSNTTTLDTPKTVEIVSTTMAFETTEITLDQGVTVRLTLVNQSAQVHDLSIDKIPGKVKETGHGGEHEMANRPDLHISAEAGGSGSIEFTPSEVGTYTYYCTVSGHKDAGMVGKLIVQ